MKQKRQIKAKSEAQKTMKAMRKKMPRHVLTVELAIDETQRRHLLKMSEHLRQIRNATLSVTLKHYEQMTRLRVYKALRIAYQENKETCQALEKQRTTLRTCLEDSTLAKEERLALETTFNELTNALDEAKDEHTNLSAQFEALRQEYRVTKEFVVDYAANVRRNKFNKVDSVTVLTMSLKLWQSVERLIGGQAKALAFHPRTRLMSFQGAQPNRSIFLKHSEGGYVLQHQQLVMPLKVNTKDDYVHLTLSEMRHYEENHVKIDAENVRRYLADKPLRDTYRVCNNRMVLKEIRGVVRAFVQITLEGRSVSKRTKQGAFNQTYGKGRIGIEIGTSTVAYVSQTEVSLQNLAERSTAKTLKQERRVSRLQRQLDRSRRAMNPDNFNADGTIKRGKKLEWTYSKRYLKVKAHLKNLQRIKAVNRKLAINELVNRLRSLGHEVIIESMNFKGLQRRSKELSVNKKGKFNRRKRFGKSILNRCPGYFVSRLKEVFEQTNGCVIDIPILAYRASQYDHQSKTYERKPLSKRMHTFRSGETVQRDIYSAFLLFCATPAGEAISQRRCLNQYPAVKTMYETWLENIHETKPRLLNSGINYH